MAYLGPSEIQQFIPCHREYSQSEARNPLHILRYATGSTVFHEKLQAFLAAFKFFPPIEEPATGQNLHSEK